MEKAKITFKQFIANKGATFAPDGKAITYASGYQVSIQDLKIMPTHSLTMTYIKRKLRAGYCLGVWIDKGLAYVDLSKRVSTKREAVELGNQNNQLSIWDWKKSCAISLG